LLALHAAELEVLQRWADEHSTELRVYCELYAPKILGRIPYGEGIVILDVMVHKTAAFAEVVKTPKGCPLMDEFQAYITPSRVAGIVSKLGPPPDKAAIGRAGGLRARPPGAVGRSHDAAAAGQSGRLHCLPGAPPNK
jgi:hypothetical protein